MTRDIQENGSQSVDLPEIRTDLTDFERRAADDRRRLFVAQRALFFHVAQRIIRRETADIRRAVTKYLTRRNDMAAFLLWLGEFYEEHASFVERQMGPPLDTLAQLVAGSVGVELGQELNTDAVVEFGADYAATLGVRWSAGGRGQIESVAREAFQAQEPIDVAVEARLDSWEETQPEKVSRRESVRATNALTKAAYVAGGVTVLRWVASGENCPYCDAMNGRVVGVNEWFANDNSVLHPPDADRPLTIRRRISHPPIHDGCDCTIIPG